MAVDGRGVYPSCTREDRFTDKIRSAEASHDKGGGRGDASADRSRVEIQFELSRGCGYRRLMLTATKFWRLQCWVPLCGKRCNEPPAAATGPCHREYPVRHDRRRPPAGLRGRASSSPARVYSRVRSYSRPLGTGHGAKHPDGACHVDRFA